MARAQDNSLMYFPLDTSFFADTRIRRLRSRFGSDGPMFLLYIYCRCYGEDGYYTRADDDFYDDAALDMGCDIDKIREMLAYLSEKDLIDGGLLIGQKVITSHGIQSQYQKSKKGSRRDVEVDAKLWILSKIETELFIVACNNSDKSGNNSDKSGNNSDKSGNNDAKNKIKENKDKEKEREEENCYAMRSDCEELKPIKTVGPWTLYG